MGSHWIPPCVAKTRGLAGAVCCPPPPIGKKNTTQTLENRRTKKKPLQKPRECASVPTRTGRWAAGPFLATLPWRRGSHTAMWPRPTPGPGLRGAEAHTHLLQGLPVQRLGVEDLRAALALPALQPVQARCARPRRAARRLRRRAGGGRGALGRGRQAWRPTGNASDGRGFAAERRVGEWVKWCCPGEKVRSWQPGPHPHIHLVARRARMSLEFKPYNFY